MLVICNGAFKSGSTWLYTLLRQYFDYQPIPDRFKVDEKWNNQTIDENRLQEFLDKVDYKTHHYLIKSHWDNPETLKILLPYKDVFVFNITRDTRDVIVSAYYHYKREGTETGSFEEYYWKGGRQLIRYIHRYHNIWKNLPGKVYVSSYEGLLNDFDTEVRRIYAFLNVKLEQDRVDKMLEATGMNSLRKWWNEEDKKSEERFFRKGEIGDWKNHFTPAIEADFNKTDHEMRTLFEGKPVKKNDPGYLRFLKKVYNKIRNKIQF